MSTSLVALCCRPGPKAPWETAIRAQNRSADEETLPVLAEAVAHRHFAKHGEKFGVAPKGDEVLQQLSSCFTLTGSSFRVNRMGYGAMQLAGRDGNKLVWGPPHDVHGAIALLREVVASGIDHIDTADFYGPHVTNQIIREALFPYPADLVIVTKVGARRGEDGSWIPGFSRDELTQAVHDNLRNLGLDALRVVNLRIAFDLHRPAEGSIEAPLTVLAELQQQGLIRHIGLSNATSTQITEARRIAPIICIQNHYNLAHRADDALVDDLDRHGIAYVPFFPLGGFTPLQSGTLSEAASRLAASPIQVALAWLLQRSPNILVIRGHLPLSTSGKIFMRRRFGFPPNCLPILTE